MGDVAVYTTVGKKSHAMQCGMVLLTVFHSLKKCRIFKEIAVLDFLGDTGQFLVYDTSRTHIHMTDFGVAHLSFGKSYRHTACQSLYKRIFRHQLVHDRGICHGNGIAVLIIIQAIAV